MAKYQGGMIGSTANATSGTNYTGKANGVFSLPQQIVNKQLALWAIGQTKPNAPSIGTATPVGSSSISVAFIPPVQFGGSPITIYTVTSSAGQTATGASSPIVVSGLTTGTSYTFTVTATNALGTSISSGTSNSTQPAITDPYFSSVSLLLNGDGTNGSQVFTDLSSTPKTITAYGNAQISTAQKKYGTGAMYFDGNGDYLTTPSNSALNLAGGNWTVEFWAYYTGVNFSNYRHLVTKGDSVNGPCSYQAYVEISTGYISFFNGTVYASTTVMPQNQWCHLAYVYSGSTLTIYLNGTSIRTSTVTIADSTSQPLNIGNYSGDLSMGHIGYIDDLRITKGIARYTSNFTPPTVALPTF
jgi:hypothetical protein